MITKPRAFASFLVVFLVNNSLNGHCFFLALRFTIMNVCMHVAIGCSFTSTFIGNYGPYLRDSGSVYITRNGGLTWEKVIDDIYKCGCI